MQPEYAPHQYTYKPNPYPEQDTVITPTTSSEAPNSPVSSSGPPEALKRPEKGNVHGIRPDELVKLAPRLKPYLRRPNPTWSEIIDAADRLRHDLESRNHYGAMPAWRWAGIWPRSRRRLFRPRTRALPNNAGGLFHGMVGKAKAGELHIERTVSAMRRAAQPNPRPPAGREGAKHQDDRLDVDQVKTALRCSSDATVGPPRNHLRNYDCLQRCITDAKIETSDRRSSG